MADKRRQHCVPVGRGGGDASAVDPQPLTGGPRGWVAPRGREKGEGCGRTGARRRVDMRARPSAAEFFLEKEKFKSPFDQKTELLCKSI